MVKKTAIQKPLKQKIGELLEALCDFHRAGLKVGELYVEIVDAYPNAKEEIQKAALEKGLYFSSQFLNGMEKIGRHEMHWRLLPGIHEGNAAQIRQLEFSDQEEIFDDRKYPLLLADGDNLMVDIRQVSKQQAKQIIGDGHIRDMAEQKVYLAEMPTEVQQALEVVDPYRITSKGLLILTANILIPRGKLREILNSM